MAEIPKVIKNMNMIMDGRGYAGLVDEVTLPELTIVTEEHRAGGMDAPIPLDMGMEQLEMSFISAEHSPNIYGMFGHQNQNVVPLTFRAAMVDDTDVWPYILKVTGLITGLSGGTVQNGQKSPLEVTMGLRFYNLVINEEELVYIDVPNMIRRIQGVDHLQLQREALGL
jgi:P2 family phage contractile tail tube protein